jgi:hypothetical protein
MGLLELLIVVVIILWVTGTGLAIGGSFIHLLLVVALVLVIMRLARGGPL